MYFKQILLLILFIPLCRVIQKNIFIPCLAVLITMVFYVKFYSLESHLSKFTSQIESLKLSVDNFQLMKANNEVNSQISETKVRQPVINVGILDYDISLRNEFLRLVELKVEDTDPRLIEFTRKLIDPPSDHMTKFSRKPVKTPQAEEIDQLLNMKVQFYSHVSQSTILILIYLANIDLIYFLHSA